MKPEPFLKMFSPSSPEPQQVRARAEKKSLETLLRTSKPRHLRVMMWKKSSRSIQQTTTNRWTQCLSKKLFESTGCWQSWQWCWKMFRKLWSERLLWVKSLTRWRPHCLIIWYPMLGPRSDSCHWNHWQVGCLTYFKELNSSQIGSPAVLLQPIGSQDSSSLKLFSQARCKTTPEDTPSLSMSFHLNSRSMMKSLQVKSMRNLKMDATAGACTWRVPVGMTKNIRWPTQTQNNFSQKFHWYGSCQRDFASSQKLAFTDAPSTRFFQEQVPCQPRAIQQISVFGWSSLPEN